MDLEFAFLADSIEILPNGAFNVVAGNIWRLAFRGFPGRAHPSELVLGIRVSSRDGESPIHLLVEWWDEDGQPIINSFSKDIPVNSSAFTTPHVFAFPVHMPIVTFPHHGWYEIRIKLNNNPSHVINIFADYATEAERMME